MADTDIHTSWRAVDDGSDAGTITGLVSTADTDSDTIWAPFESGDFQMGSTLEADEQPVHEVSMTEFEMAKTEVTVAQYLACVASGACTDPAAWGGNCYWNSPGHDDYPVNCVSWHQAVAYCQWTGGRLPSEAEWEYAARSGGQNITYPWGDEAASCEFAIMNDGVNGCGTDLPHEVCSKAAGTTSQGLCDMAGNVFEWVRDTWHSNYNGAPSDGSAWEGSAYRFVRGGCYLSDGSAMRAAAREGIFFGADYNNTFIGFRCVRGAGL